MANSTLETFWLLKNHVLGRLNDESDLIHFERACPIARTAIDLKLYQMTGFIPAGLLPRVNFQRDQARYYTGQNYLQLGSHRVCITFPVQQWNIDIMTHWCKNILHAPLNRAMKICAGFERLYTAFPRMVRKPSTQVFHTDFRMCDEEGQPSTTFYGQMSAQVFINMSLKKPRAELRIIQIIVYD